MKARLLVVCLLAVVVRAEVRLPGFYGDGMVWQRGRPMLVRGWAAPGERIEVATGENTARVEADAAGRWSVALPAPGAGPLPDLVVQGTNRITLGHLLGGDVWICSGQSNMEFKLSRAEGGAEAASKARNPLIRLFTVARRVASTPQDDLAGSWVECAPETALEFSAVGYFFGAELARRLENVPIGLIHSSWGGTPGEAWVDSALTRDDPRYAAVYEEWDRYRANYPEIKARYEAEMARWRERGAEAEKAGLKPPARPLTKPDPDNNHQYPGNLFNAMIHPLAGFPIKGVAWYHGTSNTKRAADYHALLTTLVVDWRRRWGQGDFPFLIVSLAGFHARDPEPPETSAWATLRDAQARVAREQPACGLALALDVGDPDDIHPRNKRDVGLRLAASALRVAYGHDIVASGPSFAAAERGADCVRIKFVNAAGLMCGREGGDPKLEGFALAGADRVWRWAEARIEGEDVVVSSPRVPAPRFVRYGWADNPGCNLYNRAGFPAVPFRTDTD